MRTYFALVFATSVGILLGMVLRPMPDPPEPISMTVENKSSANIGIAFWRKGEGDLDRVVVHAHSTWMLEGYVPDKILAHD